MRCNCSRSRQCLPCQVRPVARQAWRHAVPFEQAEGGVEDVGAAFDALVKPVRAMSRFVDRDPLSRFVDRDTERLPNAVVRRVDR